MTHENDSRARSKKTVALASGAALVLAGVIGFLATRTSTPTVEAQQAAADPRADSASNVRLVGYHDMQGRQALQLTARSDAANGNWPIPTRRS
jgi:hypothetical protein